MADMFITLINYLISSLGTALTSILSVLPRSPFSYLDNSPISPYLGGLNWLIPLDFIISVSTAWLSCVAVFYAYQIILRWVKAIE